MRLSSCPMRTRWGSRRGNALSLRQKWAASVRMSAHDRPSGILQQSLARKRAFKLDFRRLDDYLEARENDRRHAAVAAVDLLNITTHVGVLGDVDRLIVAPWPVQHPPRQAAIPAPASGVHGQATVDHQYRL